MMSEVERLERRILAWQRRSKRLSEYIQHLKGLIEARDRRLEMMIRQWDAAVANEQVRRL